MRQHLFFSMQSCEKINYFDCNYNIRNTCKLTEEVNKSSGYIYFHIVDKDKFYKGKIISLNEKNKISIQQKQKFDENSDCVFQAKTGVIYICMKNHILIEVELIGLIEINREDLKYLYAQRNDKHIGASVCSLFNTYKKTNFVFARPIIISEVIDSTFAEKILKDYFIVPEEQTEEKNDIYAEVTIEDNEYIISLTNDLMIAEDDRFIDGEGSVDYKPYFYEFIIDEDVTHRLQNTVEPNQTYIVQLTYMKEKITDENRLSGEVLFSASPPRNIPAYIEFLNKEIPMSVKQKIEDTEKKIMKKVADIAIVCKTEIKKRFFRNIPPFKKIDNVQVYDVGQGNLSKVQLKTNNGSLFDIVFDIGISQKTKIHPQYNSNAKQAVKELSDRYMFILSHWDLDHIKGIIYLSKQMFEVSWVIPQLPKKVSKSALRLAAYLCMIKDIDGVFVSENLNGHVVFSNLGFTLAKGKGNNPKKKIKGTRNYYNKANNLGLVLEIEDNEKKALLPGDCEYIQMPNSFLTGYDFMVASHHGAKTDLSKSGLKGGGEVIFTVNSSGKDYPDESHEKQLINLGYKTHTIYQTGNKVWRF